MTTVEEEMQYGQAQPVPGATQSDLHRGKALSLTITLSWEKVLWWTLAVAAIATRFWSLGARVMSHDESLHVYYAWLLSKGSGFAHNPMMHGPFLFEATALVNALFGANDFTSRLVPALLGIGIVILIPLLLRPWLGRTGALLCSLFFLVSPYVLYYSRYNRHDIQVIAWVLLAAFAILAYLRERKDSRLTLLAIALALMLSTFEISFIYLAIFASFLILRLLAVYQARWKAIRQSAEWDVLMVLVTLGAMFSSPIALLLLNPIWSWLTGQPFVDLNVLSSYGTEWASSPSGLRLWGLMVFFWAAAAGVGFWWRGKQWLKLAGLFLAITLTLFTTFFTNLNGVGTGFIGSLGYWLSQQDVSRGSQPWYYYFIVFPIYEYFPLIVGTAGSLVFAKRRGFSDDSRQFVSFVAWWAALILVGLTIAGEKMPWLSTHIAVPFILLAAWAVAQLLLWIWKERQTRLSWRMLAVGLPLTVLFLLTVRTSYLVNYVNYDYTTEFIGYAHGAPGVKWAMEEIEQISRRTGEGKAMKVAYDSEVSWPMTWYLRDYSGFFGDAPNRGAVDGAAVVVVGPKNWQKVEGYLGADYSRYEVIRMWWPMEGYKDLNWERIRGAVADPQMRRAVWNILWSRDYTLFGQLTQQELNPPVKWSLEDRMRIYIRKDLAGQGVGLALQSSQLPDIEKKEDAYTAKRIQVAPLNVFKPEGVHLPRNIAAAPDGSFLLADSGNSRIVRIGSQGQVLNTWGTRTAEGVPVVEPLDSPGTFNEPWGVAVGADGSVYVADTWNHRIQKFDKNGSFLTAWGTGGLSTEGLDRFWGPRGVAVAGDGKVYVTDTGNRRVAVFDPKGTFLFDFENTGEAQLDEPVGIAIGMDDRVYVADTWNRRVAVYTLDGKFERAWPVQAWESVSIDNKPYLAVNQQGQVYLTDPEGYRVLVFSSQGEILAEFGQFGEAEDDAFVLPIGVAIGLDGQVWVVDSGTDRVVNYPALAPD
jgi:uncharacterized protein (TIGR03663 family)